MRIGWFLLWKRVRTKDGEVEENAHKKFTDDRPSPWRMSISRKLTNADTFNYV
jgi:hypothetical protein